VSAFLATFAERLSCAVIDAETDRTAPLVASGRRVVADEQAALLRVAVAVARGVDPREVVGLIASEVGVLSGASRVHAFRSGSHGVLEPIAAWPEDTAVRGSAEASRFEVEVCRADEGIRGELVLRLASGRPLSKALETLVQAFLELASLSCLRCRYRHADDRRPGRTYAQHLTVVRGDASQATKNAPTAIQLTLTTTSRASPRPTPGLPPERASDRSKDDAAMHGLQVPSHKPKAQRSGHSPR
jgi:hypothetical protein